MIKNKSERPVCAGIGRLSTVANTRPHKAANPYYFHVRVKGIAGERDLLLTEDQLLDAEHRALMNQEDCPKAARVPGFKLWMLWMVGAFVIWLVVIVNAVSKLF